MLSWWEEKGRERKGMVGDEKNNCNILHLRQQWRNFCRTLGERIYHRLGVLTLALLAWLPLDLWRLIFVYCGHVSDSLGKTSTHI